MSSEAVGCDEATGSSELRSDHQTTAVEWGDCMCVCAHACVLTNVANSLIPLWGRAQQVIVHCCMPVLFILTIFSLELFIISSFKKSIASQSVDDTE